jgi:hypothetical protein
MQPTKKHSGKRSVHSLADRLANTAGITGQRETAAFVAVLSLLEDN